MRTRGFVRTVDIVPMPGGPGQFTIELRLVDASNREKYVRLGSTPLFVGSERAPAVEIEPGDEIEIVMGSGEKRSHPKDWYIHNHTRGGRYAFVKAKTGCLGLIAAGAVIMAAPVAAAWMMLLD